MQGTLLTEGARILGAARMLAAELESSPRPATRILQEHSGQRLRLDTEDPGPVTRPLADEERHRLGIPGRQQCLSRAGWLRYGMHGIAAAVTFTWLPARLPAGACVQLARTNRPAGLILEPYGVQRADRRAMVIAEGMAGNPGDDGLDIIIRSSAVLIVDGWPAAIAAERITREFIAMNTPAARLDHTHDGQRLTAGMPRPVP